MRQVPLALGPEPAQRFDNFLVMDGNAQAVSHLADGLGDTPVYLWGEPGSGKSHLLHALAARAQAEGFKAIACSADQPAPWHWDEATRLVLLDDCDRFDAPQQNAAFALFIEAVGAGVPVVSAGRMPPVDLPVRDDLRTRLGWGLVFHLQPPGEAQVRSLLRQEADRRGIFLSDEVMDHLLTRFERNLAHLMNLLDRLDQYALASQRAVTVPLLKRMLAEETP